MDPRLEGVHPVGGLPVARLLDDVSQLVCEHASRLAGPRAVLPSESHVSPDGEPAHAESVGRRTRARSGVESHATERPPQSRLEELALRKGQGLPVVRAYRVDPVSHVRRQELPARRRGGRPRSGTTRRQDVGVRGPVGRFGHDIGCHSYGLAFVAVTRRSEP